MNKIILGVFLAVVGMAVVWGTVYQRADAGELDAFAQCLAERGATMYGMYWCPHCLNEKQAFGSSFQFVPYVECSEDPGRCTEAGISGYPTWVFEDGRRFEGEQGLEKLSRVSGCPLPNNFHE